MSTPTKVAGRCAPFDDLPARALDRRELSRLVNELAADPELWQEHLSFEGAEDGGRHYASLYRDAYVDVWLLCWRPEDDTGPSTPRSRGHGGMHGNEPFRVSDHQR